MVDQLQDRPMAPVTTGSRLASFREIFSIDLRTLALFRVLLGVFIVWDLALRARDLTAHYTDFGIMPRADAVDFLSISSFSIHLMNGSVAFQVVLFLLAGVFALMLIFGWRTRLATVASWFFMLSVQNRNTFILSGEDNLAMVFLCWAVFLPLGARYSVDAALDKGSGSRPNAYFSVATVGLLLQGMSMYFFSALLKSDAQWVPDGTAVYYALQLDYLVTPFAVWFRQFGTVLQGLTYYVYVLELVGPILIFSPILHRPLRLFLMLAFMTMHLSFALFLHIGLFPFISIIMNLTFMPGWVWDWLDKKLARPAAGAVTIWYDEGCDFCRKVCHLLRTFLFLGDPPIRAAQGDNNARALLSKHDSWVVGDDTSNWVEWDALVRLVRASPVFWPLSSILSLGPVRRVGTWGYDLVRRNRLRVSRMSATAMPWKEQTKEASDLNNYLAAVFIGLMMFQNISTLPVVSIKHSDSYHAVRQFFGFYQYWTMFAPHPEMNSPWPIVSGTITDAQPVDVYNRTTGWPSTEKPAYVAGVYANYRWRKFLSNLEDQSYEDRPQKLAKLYAKYLCRDWNAGQPSARRLETLTIRFNVEDTPPPGHEKAVRTRQVYEHRCSKR